MVGINFEEEQPNEQSLRSLPVAFLVHTRTESVCCGETHLVWTHIVFGQHVQGSPFQDQQTWTGITNVYAQNDLHTKS